MATQNAIDTNKPIEVTAGGTGAATLTDHGVLIGSGTSAINAISVGSTGELVVGSTGADPAFGTSADGDFSFTSATANVTRVLTVSNTDNTVAATSAARVDIETGGSNVGDPVTKWTVTGGTSWLHGLDNSDSDSFKMANDASDLSTNTYFSCTTGGEIINPSQPAFLAQLSTQQNNVTGNGTVYTLICDTEVFDQGSNYNNSTGVFTAPVTGAYLFWVAPNFSNNGSGNLIITITINTSNRDYISGATYTDPGFSKWNECSAIVDMDASDTAFFQVAISGMGSDVSDVMATITRGGGQLVC